VHEQRTFLDAISAAAKAAHTRTGVPASVTVAQAILESDWGRSQLAEQANNYFGVKATSGIGGDGVIWLPTTEVDADGEAYSTTSAFRAYKSMLEAVTDHNELLRRLPRYAPAMHATADPRQFARLLQSGGYSTDPDYADKLISLMDRYDLYQLDA
jgi:flagellar protein FlgJ